MRCKDCSRYKPDTRTEAGKEIAPNVSHMRGICSIDSRNCMATDRCTTGGYCKK